MRIFGTIVVIWLVLQVYPHIHIDFAPLPGEKVTQPLPPLIPPPQEQVQASDELIDPYPEQP